jgi:hypothetical protein
MNLAAPFRQLVERRLWPLALLMLAALVAVPMLLAKKAEPVAPAGPIASTASAQGPTQPIVELGAAGAREAHRKVLGDRKNPFRPAIKAHKAAEPKKASSTNSSSTTDTGGADGVSVGGTGGFAPVTITPVTTPVRGRKTYEIDSLTVRFGDSTTTSPARTLKRLTALPDATAPVLIYLGLLKDRKTAVFLVGAGSKVQGDGRCEPAPNDCQTLRMKAGETAFIDAPDGSAQYQLDLVRIHTSKTADAARAAKARSAVAAGGRDALRANVSRVGRWTYDSKTGSVKKLSAKAYKAQVARASAKAAAAAA